MIPIRITWCRPALDSLGLDRPTVDDGLLAIVALEKTLETPDFRVELLTEEHIAKPAAPKWENPGITIGSHTSRRLEAPRANPNWVPGRPGPSDAAASLLEVFPFDVVALVIAALPPQAAVTPADVSHAAHQELLAVAKAGVYRGPNDHEGHIRNRNAAWLVTSCGLAPEAALPIMPPEVDDAATLALLLAHTTAGHTVPGSVAERVYAEHDHREALIAREKAALAEDERRSKELLPFDLFAEALIEVTASFEEPGISDEDQNHLWAVDNGTEVFAVAAGLPFRGGSAPDIVIRTTGSVTMTRSARARLVYAPEKIERSLMANARRVAAKHGKAHVKEDFTGDPRKALPRWHLRQFDRHVNLLARLVLDPSGFDHDQRGRALFAQAALWGLIVGFGGHVSVPNAVALTRRAMQAFVTKSGGLWPIGRPKLDQVEREILAAIADPAPLWLWGELANAPSKAQLTAVKLEVQPTLWEDTVKAATEGREEFRTADVWAELEKEGLIASATPSSDHRSIVSRALEALGFQRATSVNGERARGWRRANRAEATPAANEVAAE
jgi:hypothetical protein